MARHECSSTGRSDCEQQSSACSITRTFNEHQNFHILGLLSNISDGREWSCRAMTSQAGHNESIVEQPCQRLDCDLAFRLEYSTGQGNGRQPKKPQIPKRHFRPSGLRRGECSELASWGLPIGTVQRRISTPRFLLLLCHCSVKAASWRYSGLFSNRADPIVTEFGGSCRGRLAGSSVEALGIQ